MVAIPLVAWCSRSVRATVEEHARSQGVPVERIAGDLLAEAVQRRGLPAPDLPDLSRQTDAAHRATLDRAKAELLTGMTARDWREGEHLA
ncbi:hypothetical protein C7401_1373 [Paraburkholderia unamae]|uniref:hypothetical protein n=1 Tax=Paraburkholderia unamae TaxID=219649 RepID=UPI000DC4D219|nr:hypothetical protein [Paraburkholderia unamae]RAR51463.1 hypothetical protein C7401_1373 [Paraburkholderia unamae]